MEDLMRRTDEFLDVLSAERFVVLASRQRRHLVVRALHEPTGRIAAFTVAVSPSDHRSLLNFRGQVRRTARKLEDENVG
jgi:hypothetical protein